MLKEITFYVFFGEQRDPSKIYANPNLRNRTHITKKPSYVYVFHLHAQRNHSLRGGSSSPDARSKIQRSNIGILAVTPL